MREIVGDVLLVGSGLGATSAAVALARTGKSVVIVPGIGRTRFPHIDGGLVDPAVVADAFGPGAPLGMEIDVRQELLSLPGHRFDLSRPQVIPSGHVYNRRELEAWAMERATDTGATFLEDFVEGKALPNVDGTMTLTSERDDRSIRAGYMVLCEGADPRIPLRVKLRPDYGPEDQLHFARVHVSGSSELVLRQGSWRTSWGMPVDLALVPQETGLIVAVTARIENVMRGSRSAKDALSEFLRSAEFGTLGIEGSRSDMGVELVPLRRDRKNIRFSHDRMLMGIDASGVIDPRRADRVEVTIRSGQLLAHVLLEGPVEAWQEVASRFVAGNAPAGTTYHDDQATGYLEDVPAGRSVALGGRLTRMIQRVRGTAAQQG